MIMACRNLARCLAEYFATYCHRQQRGAIYGGAYITIIGRALGHLHQDTLEELSDHVDPVRLDRRMLFGMKIVRDFPGVGIRLSLVRGVIWVPPPTSDGRRLGCGSWTGREHDRIMARQNEMLRWLINREIERPRQAVELFTTMDWGKSQRLGGMVVTLKELGPILWVHLGNVPSTSSSNTTMEATHIDDEGSIWLMLSIRYVLVGNNGKRRERNQAMSGDKVRTEVKCQVWCSQLHVVYARNKVKIKEHVEAKRLKLQQQKEREKLMKKLNGRG
ncbi:hypothetical protein E3N88_33882 [Mikania micrantha]|uniref:Uncharacterized protein n=1 Tax=Mikania micrantha TaxID=192012 RepID=A0A5N6ME06_9ASTR|nr:hypothetical protein E3N88_33882 [Mikania micrantha]